MKCKNCGAEDYWRVDVFDTYAVEFSDDGKSIEWVNADSEPKVLKSTVHCGNCGTYISPKQAKQEWEGLII